jgi:hypothetical protein
MMSDSKGGCVIVGVMVPVLRTIHRRGTGTGGSLVLAEENWEGKQGGREGKREGGEIDTRVVSSRYPQLFMT